MKKNKYVVTALNSKGETIPMKIIKDHTCEPNKIYFVGTSNFYIAHHCLVCSKKYQYKSSQVRHMDQAHHVDHLTHPLLIWFKRLAWRLK